MQKVLIKLINKKFKNSQVKIEEEKKHLRYFVVAKDFDKIRFSLVFLVFTGKYL